MDYSFVLNAELSGVKEDMKPFVTTETHNFSGIDAYNGNTVYRLQINNNGSLYVYKSYDNGYEWSESKTILSEW